MTLFRAALLTLPVCLACAQGQVDERDLAPELCRPIAADDTPDDLYQDTNCDGIDGDAGRAIFVSPDGSDGDPGTMNQPMRTITAALAIATSFIPPKDLYLA